MVGLGRLWDRVRVRPLGGAFCPISASHLTLKGAMFVGCLRFGKSVVAYKTPWDENGLKSTSFMKDLNLTDV